MAKKKSTGQQSAQDDRYLQGDLMAYLTKFETVLNEPLPVIFKELAEALESEVNFTPPGGGDE